MIVYSGPGSIVWSVTCAVAEYYAALTDRGVYVWKTGDTEHPQFLEAPNTGRVHARLEASPDDEWLLVDSAEHLYCWQRTPEGWTQCYHRANPASCLARFTAPGTIETIERLETADGVVQFHHELITFDRNSKPKVKSLAVIPAPELEGFRTDLHQRHYYTVDLSSDGRVFLISPSDARQFLWSLHEKKLLGSVKMRNVSNEAKLSPDGSHFAVDGGTSVYVYRVVDFELVSSWRVKHCYSPQLAWSPDGQLLARADASTTVRQFDWKAGKEVSSLSLPRHRATAIRYSPDGLTYVVGTFKGPVVVWDAT